MALILAPSSPRRLKSDLPRYRSPSAPPNETDAVYPPPPWLYWVAPAMPAGTFRARCTIAQHTAGAERSNAGCSPFLYEAPKNSSYAAKSMPDASPSSTAARASSAGRPQRTAQSSMSAKESVPSIPAPPYEDATVTAMSTVLPSVRVAVPPVMAPPASATSSIALTLAPFGPALPAKAVPSGFASATRCGRIREALATSSTTSFCTRDAMLLARLRGLEHGEALRVHHGVGVHHLGAVGHLVVSLEVDAGLVGIAVEDDLRRDVAHDAPLDEVELADDGQHVRGLLRLASVHRAGSGRRDAVDVAGLEADGDLRVHAHAGRRNAQLAQLGRPELGHRDAVDVVLSEREGVGEGVDIGHGVVGRRDLHGVVHELAVPCHDGARLGVDGMVDHVVQRAAEGLRLVALDGLDDLELIVLVGPLQLVGDARRGLHLEALADERAHWLVVRGLHRALLHDLGLARAVEDEVVGVREELRGGRGQGRDGGSVLRVVLDVGRHRGRQHHLGGFECHAGAPLCLFGLLVPEQLLDDVPHGIVAARAAPVEAAGLLHLRGGLRRHGRFELVGPGGHRLLVVARDQLGRHAFLGRHLSDEPCTLLRPLLLAYALFQLRDLLGVGPVRLLELGQLLGGFLVRLGLLLPVAGVAEKRLVLGLPVLIAVRLGRLARGRLLPRRSFFDGRHVASPFPGRSARPVRRSARGMSGV